MDPAIGTRIGSYEILSRLGAGGMGEVYRARDSRLNRDVAIKVLPGDLAGDPDRVSRFERESQLLATLNHAHIAQVFGVVDLPGDAGSGSSALVMEYVEGGTLADRLRAGALPVREALRIARDVADGLEAAHDAGIIHRDLKPANVALTPQGKAKILDFGLAKAFAVGSEAHTIAGATGTGVVLGTAPYMSPQQARGLPLDRRTDIWSFGCVLYEMLAGRPAFAGPSPSDTVAAILERDPDLGLLPAATPSRVRWLVRRCLEKDRDRRLHDIADARIELEEAIANPDSGSGAAAGASAPRASRERLAWIAATAALAAVAVWAIVFRAPATAGSSPAVLRTELPLGRGLSLTTPDPAARFAISPDGRRIAFVARDGNGPSMLWVRSLDSLSMQPVSGTEGALYPFWSPDSASIAYVSRPSTQNLGAQAALHKVDLAGGATVMLADRAFGATGAWGPDDVILFTPTGNSPIHRVSAGSPTAPVAVTTLDSANGDVQHFVPSFLPDGRRFLYTALGSRTAANEARGVYLGSLDGGEPRLLIEDGSQAVYADGHLLFLRGATLVKQRFDPQALTVQGEPVRVADGVQAATRASGGTGAFSVSQAGVLLYQTGLAVRSQLAWTDRTGRQFTPLGEPADYVDVALSPDDSKVLVSALDPQIGTRDLWIYDLARGGRERLPTGPSDDFAPVWSPDGTRVAFTSVREESIELYERRLDGSGAERKLESGGSTLGKFAAHWSPDGGSLLFIAGGRALARSDIHVVPMVGSEAPKPLLESPFIETQIRFSPDGRYVAFVSNDSDQMQVYAAPFPAATPKQRVSIDGGLWPRWRRDGREMFYLATDGTLMSVPVSTRDAGLEFGSPSPLFKVRLRPGGRLDAYQYDVTRDGNRFLFNTFLEEATSTGLTLVVNWAAPR